MYTYANRQRNRITPRSINKRINMLAHTYNGHKCLKIVVQSDDSYIAGPSVKKSSTFTCYRDSIPILILLGK